ncbi:MAG: hypothetical protein GHHEDOFH_00816 [Pseudorhodoplanes sp.]|nr:hypothetical protein [Pseudorhodoplanes sp.]
MSAVIQDPSRDKREQERQALFRQRFVEQSPWWYRGEYHLAFMLIVTFGTIAYCWMHIDNSTWWEWLLIIPFALFGNWAEWAAHRYILHRPVPGLEMIYKRHCTVHHQFSRITIWATKATSIGGPCCSRRLRRSVSSWCRSRQPLRSAT